MSRWDPFSEALSLRDAMNRLFEQAVLQPSSIGQRGEGGFAPALDVQETQDEFIVEASLPGVDPNDVEIELEQGVLTIRGELNDERRQQKQSDKQPSGQPTHNGGTGQTQSQERHQGQYHVRERRSGRFFRSITLPTAVNADRAEAHFEHGVLTLRIPKAEETKPRRIQIQAGGASQQGSPRQVETTARSADGGSQQSGSQAGSATGSSGSRSR
jgi:HSP20 family protein